MEYCRVKDIEQGKGDIWRKTDKEIQQTYRAKDTWRKAEKEIRRNADRKAEWETWMKAEKEDIEEDRETYIDCYRQISEAGEF